MFTKEEERRSRAARLSAHVRENFSWERAAEVAEMRLQCLCAMASHAQRLGGWKHGHRGIRLAEAEEARIASNQKKILAALMDAADPNTPPTEDEILGLILGEVAFMHKAGVFAHPSRLGHSGTSR